MEERFNIVDPDTGEIVYVIVVYSDGDVRFFAADGTTEVEVTVEELDRYAWSAVQQEE